ncbi:zinc finger protein 62 homolog [Wyeomyia smithii]|uniref:zinc finger protein 62 homolog n=1 Tax=Wyeomyia smithii TaxID=174621 RepID=UPI00246809CA|nr:zinc finger protein 62 homolog [Wyeomyia smithii]
MDNQDNSETKNHIDLHIKKEPDYLNEDYFEVPIETIQKYEIKIEDDHCVDAAAVLPCDKVDKNVPKGNGLRCDVCGKTYKTVRTLRKHKCKGYISSTKLQYPVPVRYAKTSLQCNICSKQFADTYILQTHMILHTGGEQGLMCLVCRKRFPASSDLRKHYGVHTGERPHACRICFQGFSNLSDLEQHIEINHAAAKDYGIECDECEQIFVSEQVLSQHKSTRHAKFSCKLGCGKAFRSKEKLNVHEAKCTVNPKNPRCKVCSKVCLNAKGLKIHKKVHARERFNCETCNLSFVTQSALEKHIHINISKRRHVCEFCGKGFFKACQLKLHTPLHSSDKPHKCGICSKRFAVIHHLKLHMMRRHFGKQDPAE